MHRSLVLLLPLALTALTGCDKQEPPPEAARPVQTMVVKRTAQASNANYSGQISARNMSQQGFLVAGTLQKRLVEVGTHVTTGQPLLQLDPADLNLQLQSAKAQLDAATSQAAQAKVDFDRDAVLVEKDFISEAAYDQDRLHLETANAQLKSARAQHSEAVNQVNYSVLRAAVTGVVTAIKVDVGQVVVKGANVINLAADGDREVVINVPESRLTELRDARGLQVTLWAAPNKTYSAELRAIDPDTDPVTRTYDAHITVNNPDATVRLGMTAYVHLPDINEQPAYKLPLTAIYNPDGTSLVWIVDGNTSTVSTRPVKLLAIQGNEALVNDGLKDGEVVVTAGVNVIHAGQKVRAVGTYNPQSQ